MGDTPAITPEEYGRRLAPLLERAAGYARSLVGRREDAEDAVQQAALRGLERLGTYDAARPFEGWWFAVLRNCCHDLLRERQRHPTAPLLEAPAPPAQLPDPDAWRPLAHALDRLCPAHAEILRLRYFADLSYAQLAEALDIPLGTVMSRLHGAREALAATYPREDP